MRNAFLKTLLAEAKKNRKIILLTADLGYSVLEAFINELPQQYLNIGVAEQNMTGVAAGLAMEGKIPVIYSIVPFVTMRNFEQIRNDLCYQGLSVKIVGIGAGFSYGPYGHTHHGLEDIGILRTLPNMTILCPGDPVEVSLATEALLNHDGPVYLRLGKAGEPIIHDKFRPTFKIGKGFVISQGADTTIVATSTMVSRAIEVSEALKIRNISCGVISMISIKPIDINLILQTAKKTRFLFTLEEHSIIGGMGSAVAEILAETSINTSFFRIGVADRFTKKMGSQEYMREANDLTTSRIIETIYGRIKK